MLKVTVQFDEAIPAGIQGVVLLEMEQQLRQLTSLDCRVFKARKTDDSLLRLKRTI